MLRRGKTQELESRGSTLKFLSEMEFQRIKVLPLTLDQTNWHCLTPRLLMVTCKMYPTTIYHTRMEGERGWGVK